MICIGICITVFIVIIISNQLLSSIAHYEKIDYSQVQKITVSSLNSYTLNSEKEIKKFLSCLKNTKFFPADCDMLYESPTEFIKIYFKNGEYLNISGSDVLVMISMYTQKNKLIDSPKFFYVMPWSFKRLLKYK